jgi:predicted DNA binding CopG/RHH family protein
MAQEILRDKVLTIPVSESELELTKQEADKLGMPVTAFIRLLVKNFADGVNFTKR